MTSEEYGERLRAVIYTAGMNAAYHQKREQTYDLWDKIVRVGVALFTLAGVGVAVPTLDLSWIGFWVAMASLGAAVVLNIIPIVERAKFHGEMFRSWSSLRKDGLLEQHKAVPGKVESYQVDRLGELIETMESLNALEPFPKVKLLKKCQEDENEREWGPGIRTFTQAEQERVRREQEYASASPGA